MTARNEYGSFGEIISNSGATNSSIGYTGQRLDVESGLMALGNGERYYSPELGRFIQQDSFSGSISMPQTLNRFAYAVNSPFKYKDPTGNYIESAWDAFSLGVGIYSFQDNYRKGNYWSAALDAVGIVADTAALLLPIVPGGVGVAIRASRAAAYGVKTLQTVDRAVNIYQATTTAGEEFGKGNVGMGLLNTGFALLGAKGFNDSAKGLGKIEDFNAKTGKAPSYFKEYDKLSKDIEKLENFGQTVADYGRALRRGGKSSRSVEDFADAAESRLAMSSAKYGDGGSWGGDGFSDYRGFGMTGSKYTFNELKKMARKDLNFSTPKDSAVFWSGRNMEIAQDWAKANGKFTLEQTIGGKYLDSLDLFSKKSGLTGEQAAEVWDIASKRFASQAQGTVHTFSTGATKMNDYGNLRTWWRIERPTLISNIDVSNIFRMKKDGTKAKTGHWSR